VLDNLTAEQLAKVQAIAIAMGILPATVANEEIALVANDLLDDTPEKLSPKQAARLLAQRYNALRRKGHSKGDIFIRICRAAGSCKCDGGRVVLKGQVGKPYSTCAPARFISKDARKIRAFLEGADRPYPCKF